MTNTNSSPLELAEVITALRQELISAQQQGQDESLKFNIKNIDIELETVVEREVEGTLKGKIRFWVVDADAEGKSKYKKGAIQKIKLTLEPIEVILNADGSKSENKSKINDKA